MPARVQTRPSTSAADRARAQPEYQPLQQPLTAIGQESLGELGQSRTINDIHALIQGTLIEITESASKLIDNVALGDRDLKQERTALIKQNEKYGTVNDTEEARLQQVEQRLGEKRANAEALVKTLDKHVQQMLDDQRNVEQMVDLIKVAAAFPQVSGRSRRQLRNADGELEDADDSDDANGIQDFTPTTGGPTQQGSSATQPSFEAPSKAFRTAMEKAKTLYQCQSRAERYTANNDYRRFRAEVHDSRYPDGDAPPMAHDRTWFKDDQVAGPGMTARTAGQDDAEEDDEDIAMVKERISTKDPLTMMEMTDPLSSKKCPHSFERSSIEQLFNASDRRLGPRGPQIVQCPIPACSQQLTRADLHEDALLRSRIERLQRSAREKEEAEANNRDEEAELIPSDDVDEDAMDVDRPSIQQLKQEKRASLATRRSGR